MPEWITVFLQGAGQWAGLAFVALLCLGGVVLSCITLSGTWLVALAAALAAWWSGDASPGWDLVLIFVGISIAIETVEWFASAWGVQKRGGSKLAGVAALAGGIAGLFLGTFIPIPILGSLIGMVAGSFTLAYAAEKHKLKTHDHAMHIAWGTVTARVFMLFVKVGATLGMIAFLAIAMFR